MKYTYPIWFRLLHLWLGYMAAVFSAIVLAGLHMWNIAIGYLLVVALIWYVLDVTVLRSIPTSIEINGSCISLSRWKVYREFRIADIAAVYPDYRNIFLLGAFPWTKVEVAANGHTEVFYIDPHIRNYADLMHRISNTAGTEMHDHARDRIFSWTIFWKMYEWLGLAMIVGVLIGLAFVPFSSKFPAAGTAIWLAGLLLCCYLVISLFSRTLTRVELSGYNIRFGFLFGTSMNIDRSQIASVEMCRKPVGGYTILLADGRRFLISAMFPKSHELAERLKPKHGR